MRRRAGILPFSGIFHGLRYGKDIPLNSRDFMQAIQLTQGYAGYSVGSKAI
jgi:hypothetical protein